MNPLEISLFTHKCDLKHNPICKKAQKLDKWNPIKQISQTITPINLFIEENYHILHESGVTPFLQQKF